jgi:transposase-like protein
MNKPKTLQQAIKHFADADNCLSYMVRLRWPDGKIACPACGRTDVVFLKNQRKWQCKSVHAKRQFSAKVGTIFEDSALPLEKWLVAVWMLANCKNGISSYEIARALGVTQKTAWFMMHRIRLAMQNSSIMKIGGPGTEVEVDETFIGGKARNMHRQSSRRRLIAASGVTGKAIAVGLLERGGEIRTTVVSSRRRKWLHSEIKEKVHPGSLVYTDNFMSYVGLPADYVHKFVDHARSYVQGRVHTNGLENFWSLLKRGIRGTYISLEPFHLFRYLDEQAFRYNNRATVDRKVDDGNRFDMALSRIVGKRLTYSELTGKTTTTDYLPN